MISYWDKDTVIITGTHGKTTTATIAAYLLEANAVDPSWFIGGVPKSLANGAHLSEGNNFVIEGDEYDSAFFDKRSKFIHYNPYIVSINNLEMDHADIFRDLADIQRSFSHLIRLIPRRGYLIVNGDDANVLQLLDKCYCSLLKVGIEKGNDLVIHDFKEVHGVLHLSFISKINFGQKWIGLSMVYIMLATPLSLLYPLELQSTQRILYPLIQRFENIRGC